MMGEYNVGLYAVMQDAGAGAGTTPGSQSGLGEDGKPGFEEDGLRVVDPVGRTPCYFNEEELGRFEAALGEVAGAVGFGKALGLSGGEELGLRVLVEAEGALEALGGVERMFRRAARRAYGGGVRVVEARVVELSRSPDVGGDDENDSWRRRAREELVGIREGAGVIGRSEQRMRTLDKERSAGLRTDFPLPVVRLEAGPFWAREDLRAFRRAYEAPGQRGRRRGGPDASLVELTQLRRVRKEKGFNRQEDLAVRSKVSVPTISHAERGGLTQRETAEKLAAALEETVERLEGRVEVPG